MLSIAHSMTGAFVASQLPHPGLYMPITLGLHYIEDWIPHWDVGTGLSKGKRSRKAAILLEFVDLGLSALIVFTFAQLFPSTTQLHIYVAAFAALVPDFLEAPRNFLKWEPKWLKPFNDFHHHFHHSVSNIAFGLAPQFFLIVLMWGLVSRG